ncbi:winged helix-turn-helix transcriptional regulator [Marivirga sp. S37H4]|uniref:Winged helix-turn-helix transcriptional regulator n=1 Tax=Marivirga aurantiaca TaxID=2802615 RepID=A0A934WZU2_9BACT|nr:winged helix-turn-helix domain-containing protein [Marivirga aurantiaca]MBK6266059.1 winged helix-turn-helix transcriptional regulator [Marivirga aurantiaca]
MNVKTSKAYRILLKTRYLILFGACILLLVAFNLSVPKEKDLAEKQTRIALRSIGDDLLTYNNDFQSTLPPIEKIQDQKYLIKFNQPIAIHPDNLAASSVAHLSPEISDKFIVNVIDADLKNIVYEFEINHSNEKSIPCKGRNLKKAMYEIEVDLYHQNGSKLALSSVSFTGISIVLFIFFGFLAVDRNVIKLRSKPRQLALSLDRINNLISFDDKEVKLTDKEMEIMIILTKDEGKLVARDYIIEEVWSKQGVVTGRSLDMYISRLRKKLGEISKAQIINEHAKGYRLIS